MSAPNQLDEPGRVTQLVDTLRTEQDGYAPNAAVREYVGARILGAVVGPSHTGKTTIINEAVLLDTEFYAAGSFTTRPPRDHEVPGEYDFIDHTESGLTTINDLRKNGEVVQYTVHPTLGLIYGSMPAHYRGRYNLRPIASSAIGPLFEVPFEQHHLIGVTTDGYAWQNRFLTGFAGAAPDTVRGRIEEGFQSLEWCLEQPELHWVVNDDGQQRSAALEVVELMKHGATPSANNRRSAEKLYKFIRQVRADIKR